TASGAPPAAMLRAGLAESPWIARVAGFGPDVVPGSRAPTDPVDRFTAPVRALEIFEVQRPAPAANLVSTSDAVTVSGGPESLLSLLDNQLLARDRPAVLAGDGGAPDSKEWLVTDGLRHRERNVGR